MIVGVFRLARLIEFPGSSRFTFNECGGPHWPDLRGRIKVLLISWCIVHTVCIHTDFVVLDILVI